jgi:orotate phosphoribosyltransferase
MAGRLSLASRIKASAKLTGTFVLRSGAVSTTYFDKYRFEADPTLLLDIATEMTGLVPRGTEVLAGLEMGGIPVVGEIRSREILWRYQSC